MSGHVAGPRFAFVPCLVLLSFAACHGGSGSSAFPDVAPDPMGDAAEDGHVFKCDNDYVWPVPKKPVPITDDGSWKPRMDPGSTFNVHAATGSWVKFHIFLEEPDKVYFQDGNVYAYHYDFAKAHLDPFEGMTLEQYNALTLREAGQKAVLGTVLFSQIQSEVGATEVAVQFERADPMHPELVRALFQSVLDALDLTPPRQAYYFPTFSQKQAADAGAACFAQYGIKVGSGERWQKGDACYAGGWAFGRLKYVDGEQIDAAYGDGTLKPTDVLLTNATPAEVPFLAGIISLTPSTPNSHVAILAATFGVPFVYIRSLTPAQLTALDGKEVVLRARSRLGACEVRVFDVTGKLDTATRDALLARKAPPVIDLAPKEKKNAYHLLVDALGSADARFVGGKAANFGYLRRAIPNDAPRAVALTFDLWDEFMAQTIGGKALSAEIASRLAGLAYPQEIRAIKTALAGVRTLITEQASFTAAQVQAIEAAVVAGGFGTDDRLRFRSSTNAEDSDDFTGAGLYASYSGCLADDTDGDATGPSKCDSGNAKEKSALLAIRRVFASFFNDNAYLERRRLGIDEGNVGMAIVIHRSFPDEEELANGVATLAFDRQGSDQFEVNVVTQKGAVSVTNPVGGAVAEELVLTDYSGTGTSFFVTPKRQSSLVPVGTYVMTFETDYRALAALLVAVFAEWRKQHPVGAGERVMLDFEFKKLDKFEGVPVPNGKVVVKQVRRVPLPPTGATLVPILMGDPLTSCTVQGEVGDVWANHRLKTNAVLAPRPVELTAAGRQSSLFANVQIEIAGLDGATFSLGGAPQSFPGAVHDVVLVPQQPVDLLRDRFDQGSGTTMRAVRIEAAVPRLVTAADTPILSLDDLLITVTAEYSNPVPYADFNGTGTRTADATMLWHTCGAAVKKWQPITEKVVTEDGVTVASRFWWADLNEPFLKTFPLGVWDQTVITGLIAQPITLTGYFSQSNRPAHHNFSESFLFEPRLEPGIDPAIITALEAIDVAAIAVDWPIASGGIRYVGLDGQLRAAP
ncbi:MAG: hypothetical protein FJ087_16730 [Deltaproteobacteria bacterium]|nr:hypothetical protein [Deltaproteobacteria bacterium]